VLDEISVDELAERIGIGSRHLHRLFTKHVGASPIAVAQTRRLHFAKRLLDETDLPITQVALASGFGSLRRFNYTFQQTYNRAPRDLRRQRRRGVAAADADEVVLKLAFRPPYDWTQVRDFLKARAVPGVERVDERGYARTVKSDAGAATVCIRALIAKTLWSCAYAARHRRCCSKSPARRGACSISLPIPRESPSLSRLTI
jgi:AraC family transcriptional regulator of adaptative response / DNA-3-methyladenine glycosylase II